MVASYSEDARRRLAELNALNARVDRGRAELWARDLPYPGGDACPSQVVKGLAKLTAYLAQYGTWMADDGECHMALAWIMVWVDAGAAMLPEELRKKGNDDVG